MQGGNEVSDRGHVEEDSVDISAIMGDETLGEIHQDYGMHNDAPPAADDVSAYGFASVTSSITRETLAGESGKYSHATPRHVNHGGDVEDDFLSDADGTKEQTDSDLSSAHRGHGDIVKSFEKDARADGSTGLGGFFSNTRRRRLCLVGAGILVVAAVLIAVGVVVVTGRERQEKTPQAGEIAISSTTTPTDSPTLAPTHHNQVFFADLLRATVRPTTEDAPFVHGTPQNLAFEWFLQVDPLKIELDGSDLLTAKAMQRYALATFYYAMGGENWSNRNNWLQGDECGYQGAQGWYGVGCDDFGMVRALALDDNNLVGEIPNEVAILTAMENFVLKNSKGLTGSIPEDVGSNMTEMRQLALYNNDLSGPIPHTLYDGLTNLIYLNLQGNRMTGKLMPEVGNLKSLQKLILFNNDFHGPLHAKHLAETQLVYLGLSGNRFSGSIAHQIGNIPTLEFLYLDNNDFTGIIESKVGLLTELRSMNLDYNNFNGTIPVELGNLVNLEYLSAMNNSLSGELPIEIGNMVSLQTFSLATNELKGPIPDEIGNLAQLKNLYLFQNKLTGDIPASVGSLENLRILFLSSNELSSIPPEISNVGDTLVELYLSDNRIKGTIPEQICDLVGLEVVFLDTNSLQGEIPHCIGDDLADLRQLYLFNNGLTGQIPVGLSNLEKLTALGLENNMFTGDVDKGICALTNEQGGLLGDLWTDCSVRNGGLDPEVDCSCCDVCCPGPNCF